MAKTNVGTDLPAVRKTSEMIDAERRFKSRDLRLVIPELFETHGNQSAVATALGVDQSTLSRWMERLGIELVKRAVLVVE